MLAGIHTSFSVHWADKFAAHSVRTSGAPLQLSCSLHTKNSYSNSELTIYTYDQILTDRLVMAINEIIAARKAELTPATQDVA